MAENRTVSVTLSAKVNAFKADMAAAGKAASDAAQKTETAWDKSNTGVGKTMQKIGQYQSELTTAGTAMATFGGVVVGALGLTAKAAMSWESAWTGVLKTVDGTPRQLAKVQEGLRGLSRVLPATHEEIAGVAEAAGQLGIQTSNVVSFTKTMINMGESTNLSAEEAATSLARFSNIMGTNQKDVGRLGASVVGLGNNFATTEREIVEMGMRIAGAGAQAGMTEGDVLGLAAALSSVGIDAEAGGTAISMVMKKIGNAAAEGGDSMAGFADVAGMSSKEFSAAWKDDAAGALATFVTGLGDAQAAGENVNGTLSALGITGIRESDALLRLSGASDVLKQALASGNDEYSKGIALMIEANKRYETAESKIRIAGNSMKDSAITIGGTFLPAIAGASEGVADLAEWVGKLPRPVLEVGAALGGLGGAATLAVGGVLLLAPKVFELITAFGTLKTQFPGLTGGMSKFGKIAGGVTVGVAAIAGAAIAASEALKAMERTTSSSNFMEAIVMGGGNAEAVLKGVNREMDDVSKVGEKTGKAFTAVDDLTGAFDRLYNSTFSDKINTGLGWIPGVESGADKASAAFKELDGAVTDLAEGGSMQAAQDGFKAVMYEGRATGVSLDETFNRFPEYKKHIESVAEASGMITGSMSESERQAVMLKIAYGEITPAMLEAGASANGNAEDLKSLGVTAETTEEKISSLADEIRGFGSETLDARDAARQVEAGWDDLTAAIKSGNTSLDNTTEAGRKNNETLDSQARKINAVTASNLENGDSAEVAAGKHEKLRDKLIKEATAFFGSEKKAKAYVDQVLKTPDEIETDVKINTGDATAKLKKTKQWLDSLVDKTIWVRVNETHIRKEGDETVYSSDPKDKSVQKFKYYGGIDLMPMAAGGVHSNIAEMVKPNTWRVVGDRMDVDEAFIPLDGSPRSKSILMEAVKRMPGLGMAKGGITSNTAESRKADEEERKLARERLKAIREMQADLRKDLRRGTIRDQVSGGLSGGLSAVDQLSRFGSDENLSRGSRSKANSSARKFEANLSSLYSQAERIDDRLKKAQDKATELKGIKDSVVNSLLGGRELDVGTFQTQTNGQWESHSNLGQAAKGLRVDVGAMKAFAGKLKKLTELGVPGSIIQEIAQAGVSEGSNMADSFIDATVAERKSYMGAWSDYEKYANQAGQYVTEGFQAGGASAADGVVKGLEGKKKSVESAIANLAKAMESTFKQVLGIHSPSRVMSELGGFTAEGLVQGMLGGAAGVQSAADVLAQSAMPNMMAFAPDDMAFDVTASPVVEDDEGMAGLAMQDMSTTTLEAMQLMQQGVSDGWAAMLFNTQEMQAGLLLGTQTNNAAMSLNTSETMAAMLLNLQTQQSAMLLDMQTKQASMLLGTQTQYEAMRLTTEQKQIAQRAVMTDQQELMRLMLIDKQASMLLRSSTDFESMKTTTGTKFGDMRKNTDTTMSDMYSDYSGRLGDLKGLNKRGFESILATSNANMEGVRDGIDGQMAAAKPELGNRLNSLINVLSSFTASVNKAFGDVGVELTAPKSLKFATGGVMPGYTPGRDVHQFSSPTAGNLYLSGGEAIMRPEFTRAVGGEQGVKRLNKAARQGGDNVHHMLGSQGFATGGVYGPTPGVNAFADSGVWRNLWAITKSEFPNATLNSAYRGGSITASGNTSHHSRGNAIDVNPSMDIFNFWRGKYGANLAELIYSPAGGKQIKNGSNYTYTGAVKSMHYNHVHIAAIKALSDAMAGGLPGMGGEMSHPFLDRAKVKPGDDLEKSYGAAAQKLLKGIVGKHAGMLPDGIGEQLGKGIMAQASEGLIGKAKKFGKNAGAGDFGNVASGPVKQMAKEMLKNRGWEDQFGDLDWLLKRESGWNPKAQNPTSTAYGLFQFLNSTWGSVGGSKTSDPKKQLEYGLKYIQQRYGDVRGARSFWERNHWYANGTESAESGWAMVGENGPEAIRLNGGEQVKNAADTRRLVADNRTFIPNQRSGFDTSALSDAMSAAIQSNGINANDLAAALNGVKLTFQADGQQFTGAVTAVVGSGYDESRSRLAKSSQKIGAR